MLFIMSINFTDQGIRNIKDGPKRAKAARELANKLGVEIKQLYMTSGETDLVAILDTANATTSPNSRSRSARKATCERALSEPGLIPNMSS
jgi:uncharacterized protein with GYD domain